MIIVTTFAMTSSSSSRLFLLTSFGHRRPSADVQSVRKSSLVTAFTTHETKRRRQQQVRCDEWRGGQSKFNSSLLLTKQCHNQIGYRIFTTRQYNMTGINDESSYNNGDNSRTTFDIPALKKETMRLILRTHKKIGNVSTRIRSAEEQYDKLRSDTSSGGVEGGVDEKLGQQMEQAPNIEQYKQELTDLQSRLQKLNWLDEQINQLSSIIKGSKKHVTVQVIQNSTAKFSSLDGARIVQLINELEINDNAETIRLQKIEIDIHNKRAKAEKDAITKEKAQLQQQQQGGRLPYRRYYSEQRTEIRVSCYDILSHELFTQANTNQYCTHTHTHTI